MMKRRNQEWGGVLELSIIMAMVFFAVAMITILWAKSVREQQKYAAEADGLAEVQRALIAYASSNKSNFQNGKTIMYVNNQYAPTIAELQNLKFLTSNGVNVTNPWGSTYATTLTLQPSGAITGMVYLAGSIKDDAGNPDRTHACNIARALGDTGVCTPPTNAGLLGNSATQVANPTGEAGAVGALISLPP